MVRKGAQQLKNKADKGEERSKINIISDKKWKRIGVQDCIDGK